MVCQRSSAAAALASGSAAAGEPRAVSLSSGLAAATRPPTVSAASSPAAEAARRVGASRASKGRSKVARRTPIPSSIRLAPHLEGTSLAMMLKRMRSPLAVRTRPVRALLFSIVPVLARRFPAAAVWYMRRSSCGLPASGREAQKASHRAEPTM